MADFLLLLREVLAGNSDALEDLDFMSGLILILVHVAPEGDVHLHLPSDCLREDPPLMAMEDHILEVRILSQESLEVPHRRPQPGLDDPEAHVQVGTG